ncbi:retrotransposon protein putative unclassified, partial [Trifolium medium]|nr:retrotransposon protein putative unclassified [Trifolium medium]
GVQPQVPRGNPVFQEFCRMNLPTFEGQYEPTEASEWLFRMENVLEDLECTPAEKVTFATRFFRGAASNWW